MRMPKFLIDIGNGLEPKIIPADSHKDAAMAAFSVLSTEICTVQRAGDDVVYSYKRPRCPKCGYSQADQDMHMDHRLCNGVIPQL
jgi:hypothetical protein